MRLAQLGPNPGRTESAAQPQQRDLQSALRARLSQRLRRRPSASTIRSLSMQHPPLAVHHSPSTIHLSPTSHRMHASGHVFPSPGCGGRLPSRCAAIVAAVDGRYCCCCRAQHAMYTIYTMHLCSAHSRCATVRPPGSVHPRSLSSASALPTPAPTPPLTLLPWTIVPPRAAGAIVAGYCCHGMQLSIRLLCLCLLYVSWVWDAFPCGAFCGSSRSLSLLAPLCNFFLCLPLSLLYHTWPSAPSLILALSRVVLVAG